MNSEEKLEGINYHMAFNSQDAILKKKNVNDSINSIT